ncbi:hypothetical protein ACFWMP_18380 [Paenibacillus sp. NPDC058367]
MSFYLYQRISLPKEAMGEAQQAKRPKAKPPQRGTPFTGDI